MPGNSGFIREKIASDGSVVGLDLETVFVKQIIFTGDDGLYYQLQVIGGVLTVTQVLI